MLYPVSPTKNVHYTVNRMSDANIGILFDSANNLLVLSAFGRWSAAARKAFPPAPRSCRRVPPAARPASPGCGATLPGRSAALPAGGAQGLVAKKPRNETNPRLQSGVSRIIAQKRYQPTFCRDVKVQKCPKMNFHPGRKVGESAKTAENALSQSADLHFRPKMTEAQSSNPGLQAFLAFFASRAWRRAGEHAEEPVSAGQPWPASPKSLTSPSAVSGSRGRDSSCATRPLAG